MAEARSRTALITGIRGQDGSYLAEILIAQGYRVVGTSRGADGVVCVGESKQEVPVVRLDLTDAGGIQLLLERFQPDEIYNLAARASSAQLFDDSITTLEINGIAVVRFLEAIRHVCPTARFCQASSSEVFAKAGQSPQDESTPLRPRNAYGAAKVYAQNMVEAYRDRYGLFACSAILYNHESPRRGLEYVTRKVTSSAVRIAAGLLDSLVLGNLDSRRDWGFAGDYARAMTLMLRQAAPEDYVIATGQTHSVRELCERAFSSVGLDYRDHIVVDNSIARVPETVELRGNPSKAMANLDWRPSVSFVGLIAMMTDADRAAVTQEIQVMQ